MPGPTPDPTTDAPAPLYEAIARLVLAARWSGADDASLERWGAWLDEVIAQGLGSMDVVLGPVAARGFGLATWDAGWEEADRVGALLAATHAPEAELARWHGLVGRLRRVTTHGAWQAEDGDGFTGGWAIRGALGVGDVPGAVGLAPGLRRVAELAQALGLDAVAELRRDVTPHRAATTLVLPLPPGTDPLATFTEALAKTFGRRPPPGADAALPGAAGPTALVASASDRAIVQLGLRVPVGEAAQGQVLTAVGASPEVQGALTRRLAALGVARPTWVELRRTARAEHVVVGCVEPPGLG